MGLGEMRGKRLVYRGRKLRIEAVIEEGNATVVEILFRLIRAKTKINTEAHRVEFFRLETSRVH